MGSCQDLLPSLFLMTVCTATQTVGENYYKTTQIELLSVEVTIQTNLFDILLPD